MSRSSAASARSCGRPAASFMAISLNSKNRCPQISPCVPIGRFEFLRKYKRFTNKDINPRAFTVRIQQLKNNHALFIPPLLTQRFICKLCRVDWDQRAVANRRQCIHCTQHIFAFQLNDQINVLGEPDITVCHNSQSTNDQITDVCIVQCTENCADIIDSSCGHYHVNSPKPRHRRAKRISLM